VSEHALAAPVAHRGGRTRLPGRIASVRRLLRLALMITVVTPPMYLSDAWLRVAST